MPHLYLALLLMCSTDAMTEAEVRAVLEKEEEEEARLAGDLDVEKTKGRNSSVTVFVRLGLYLEDLQCVYPKRVCPLTDPSQAQNQRAPRA